MLVAGCKTKVQDNCSKALGVGVQAETYADLEKALRKAGFGEDKRVRIVGNLTSFLEVRHEGTETDPQLACAHNDLEVSVLAGFLDAAKEGKGKSDALALLDVLAAPQQKGKAIGPEYARLMELAMKHGLYET